MKLPIIAFGLLLCLTALRTPDHRAASPHGASVLELRADDRETPSCRLNGSYGATLTGKAPGFGDVNGTGTVLTDGIGRFTGKVGGIANLGGIGTVFQSAITGLYAIDRDCSLTFSMTFVALNTTVQGIGSISTGGKEVHILVTSPSSVQLTGTALKQ